MGLTPRQVRNARNAVHPLGTITGRTATRSTPLGQTVATVAAVADGRGGTITSATPCTALPGVGPFPGDVLYLGDGK